jgi:hypothetical protein
MTFADKEDPSPNERPADEVEFIIIDPLTGSGDERPGGPRNTGALIDLDSMLTHVPLQPGDMVRLGRGDASNVPSGRDILNVPSPLPFH